MARLVSKYVSSSARTSSASRDSDRVVKPTRSAKRTETRRRSVVGLALEPAPADGDALGVAAASASPSALPHSPQNLAPGVFAEPQVEQLTARRWPQFRQNFLPGSFSAAQLVQVITRAVAPVEWRKYRLPIVRRQPHVRRSRRKRIWRAGSGALLLALALAVRRGLGRIEQRVDGAACLEGRSVRPRGERSRLVGPEMPAALASDVEDLVAAMLLGGSRSVIGEGDGCFASGPRSATHGASGFEESVRAAATGGAALRLESVNASIGHERLSGGSPAYTQSM